MALESKMAQLGDRVGGDPGRTEAALELAAPRLAARGEAAAVSEPDPAARGRPLPLPDPDRLPLPVRRRLAAAAQARRRAPDRARPLRRRSGPRAEIEELTGQTRVPVLIDGDEVIHDSKRILEYLEWRTATGGESDADAWARLYNLKRWKRQRQRSRSATWRRASSRSCSPARRTPTRRFASPCAAAGAPASSTPWRSTRRRTRTTSTSTTASRSSSTRSRCSSSSAPQVDYVEGLQGAGFAVNNPNVVAACGCGSSFQVKEGRRRARLQRPR